jgi:hypothetical protein
MAADTTIVIISSVLNIMVPTEAHNKTIYKRFEVLRCVTVKL